MRNEKDPPVKTNSTDIASPTVTSPSTGCLSTDKYSLARILAIVWYLPTLRIIAKDHNGAITLRVLEIVDLSNMVNYK